MGAVVWLMVYIFFVEAFSFFLKAMAGFGDPLISSPLLSLTMENRMISPLNLLVGLPFNGYISWQNRKAFSLRRALPTVACILAGIIPGTLLLKYGAPWALKAVLGVLLLGIGAEMATRNKAKKAPPKMGVMAVVSFISGVCSGLFGINLLFVAYVERTAANRSAFRGNICFVFLAENLFRVVVYAFTGVFTRQVFLLFPAGVAGALLGFWVGTKVDKRMSEAKLRAVVIALFMLGGLSVLVRALIER